MAEKNTLSILESIKQKMIQFDQKDPKKTSSFSGDEFAYISPEKNNSSKDTGENAAQTQENQSLNKDPELNNNDQKKSAVDFMDEEDHEENPFISNPLTQDNDDFLFEADDEIVETQKKSFLQHDVSEAEENKLEVDNKKKEEISKSEVEVKKEEISPIPNKAPIENKVENQALDEDDLDLDDLDLDDDEPLKPEVKKDESQNHDLGFDEDEDFLTFDDEDEDLDIEEITNKKEEITPEPKKEEVASHFDEDEDLDLDIKEPVNTKEEVKLSPKKEEVLNHFDEDEEDDFFDSKKSEDKDFLSDIDLDSEDEIIEEKKPEPMKPVVKEMPIISNVKNLSPIPTKKDQADQPLISEETLQQTTSSIRKLIDANNVVHGMKSFSNPNSSAFSELAVQLMEPKLEKWLNDHLANLVEEIVREEIKKIIPKD